MIIMPLNIECAALGISWTL